MFVLLPNRFNSIARAMAVSDGVRELHSFSYDFCVNSNFTGGQKMIMGDHWSLLPESRITCYHLHACFVFLNIRALFKYQFLGRKLSCFGNDLRSCPNLLL